MKRTNRYSALIAALLLVTLGRPAPAAAVSAGCSTIGPDGRPLGAGKLFVQAAYGIDESTLFRFYVDGPETKVVYEGHEPQSFFTYLSGLTPGTYDWMLDRWIDNGDGTSSFYRKTLATCTVSGSVVTPTPTATPPSGGGDGAAQLSVPALVGYPFSFVADLLAGFRNVELVYADSSAPRREVVAQSIRAGRVVDAGTKLIITLSSGMAPATPSDSPAASNPPASVEPTPTALVSPSVEILTSPSPTSEPAETAVAPPLTGSARPPTTGLLLLAAGLFTGLLILLAALRRRRRR